MKEDFKENKMNTKGKWNFVLVFLILLIILPCLSCEVSQEIQSQISGNTKPIGKVTNISIVPDLSGHGYSALIAVSIAPYSWTTANKSYVVELYERGKLREKSIVVWNQPQVNVGKTVKVYFPASKDERDSYMFKNLQHIFSVIIKE